jgi:hypothetical protein
LEIKEIVWSTALCPNLRDANILRRKKSFFVLLFFPCNNKKTYPAFQICVPLTDMTAWVNFMEINLFVFYTCQTQFISTIICTLKRSDKISKNWQKKKKFLSHQGLKSCPQGKTAL